MKSSKFRACFLQNSSSLHKPSLILGFLFLKWSVTLTEKALQKTPWNQREMSVLSHIPEAVVFQLALKNRKVFSFSVCSKLLHILNVYHSLPFRDLVNESSNVNGLCVGRWGKEFFSFYVIFIYVYTFPILSAFHFLILSCQDNCDCNANAKAAIQRSYSASWWIKLSFLFFLNLSYWLISWEVRPMIQECLSQLPLIP